MLTTVLPVHNEALVGDYLTTVRLNMEWRRIVTSALQFYWRHGKSELALDNEDLLDDLLEDLYTAESIGPGIVFNHVFLTKNIGLNFTVTSSAFSIVTGSNISFTPSRANFKVTAHNTLVQNSNNLGITYIQVRFNGVESENQGIAANTGTNFGSHDCAAIYEGVSVGVSHDISIYAKRDTANGLIARANDILYEIVEWD